MHKSFKKVGRWIKLAVKTKVYTLPTIYAAGYVFMDKAYVYLDVDGADNIAVWLLPKQKKADLEVIAVEFCQELLNYSHYFTSLKVNAESAKILLQRALFSAAPSLVQEAEEKEIQDLIKELEQEEKKESKKGKK